MPRFRTGHRVPLNVYDGDRPIFQAHTEQDAAKLVALLNVGHRHGTLTHEEFARAFERAAAAELGVDVDEGICFDGFDAESLALVAMNVLLRAPETPVERPESPSEPPPATGHPESREGHTGLVVEHVAFRASESSPRLLPNVDGHTYERVGERCGYDSHQTPCSSCYRAVEP